MMWFFTSRPPQTSLALIAILFFAWSGSITRAVDAPVTLSIEPASAGELINPEFTGLSYEVALVLPAANGVHYFRADNAPLVALFRTLGIKSLRIGGNTSDRNVRQLPAEADLASLFGFAKAAGVKVIYCPTATRWRSGRRCGDGEIYHGPLCTLDGRILDRAGAERLSR